jgi:hypothetical protein
MPDASRACRVQREDRYGSRAGQGQLSVGAQSGNERLMRPSATRREPTWKRQVKTGPIRPDVRKERRSPPRCAKLTCSTDCGAGERGGAGGPRWTKDSIVASVLGWCRTTEPCKRKTQARRSFRMHLGRPWQPQWQEMGLAAVVGGMGPQTHRGVKGRILDAFGERSGIMIASGEWDSACSWLVAKQVMVVRAHRPADFTSSASSLLASAQPQVTTPSTLAPLH